MTWEEVCAIPSLRGLPFRIETNGRGQIIMSPPHNDHGIAEYSICKLLEQRMPGGEVSPETVIDTEDGNKIADATWRSDAFVQAHAGQASFRHAPEICVEVKSPSNSRRELLEKKALYFKAGAREVWIREEDGQMLFFGPDGPLEQSQLCPSFPPMVAIRGAR